MSFLRRTWGAFAVLTVTLGALPPVYADEVDGGLVVELADSGQDARDEGDASDLDAAESDDAAADSDDAASDAHEPDSGEDGSDDAEPGAAPVGIETGLADDAGTSEPSRSGGGSSGGGSGGGGPDLIDSSDSDDSCGGDSSDSSGDSCGGDSSGDDAADGCSGDASPTDGCALAGQGGRGRRHHSGTSRVLLMSAAVLAVARRQGRSRSTPT